LGKKVRLEGISQRGKNRTRSHGNVWQVLAETDRVLFSPDKPGPWLFVAPLNRDMHDKACRWVHTTTDPDFSVFQLIN